MGKRFKAYILLFVILAGFVFAAVGCTLTVPAFDASKLDPAQETIIYDKYGQPAITLRPSKSIPVPLQDIPINLRNAVIATEDSRFYEHPGIDLRGMARALVRDIASGGKVEGGSTITQQLARWVFLNDQKTFSRKIEEIILAAQLERHYTKDEILEMYLNKIYFGGQAYGVEMAARQYFGVSVKDLNGQKDPIGDLAKCALIAGLPQAPSYYNPFVHPQAAKERRDIVLENMYKNGYITQEQMDAAKQQPVPTSPPKTGLPVDDSNKYPWFLDYVLEEAENLGISADEIMRGGYRIYTTLDPQVQEAMQQTYEKTSLFQLPSGQLPRSAAVVLDPKTGGIAGIIGGMQYKTFRGFNYATMNNFTVTGGNGQSPGSTIKPLVDYGPAIETGRYGPNSLLKDQLITYGSGAGAYTPHNWDGRYRGTMTLRAALEQSENAPAVWLLDQIGIKTGLDFAKKLGLPVTPDDYNHLAVALGATSKGASPLIMAQAYAAFDNGGQFIKAHAITKIVDGNGRVLVQPDYAPTQVMQPRTAATMTDLLKSVVDHGLGTAARIPGYAVAGKTGTQEYAPIKGQNTDLWFVGYTPDYVGAIWMGPPDGMNYIPLSPGQQGEYGSGKAAAVFQSMMTRIIQTEHLPPKPFPGLGGTSTPTPPPEQTPPSQAIADLAATVSPNGSKVDLRWTPVQGDVSYRVYRTENGGPQALVASVTSGSWTDDQVAPGGQYQYVVAAVDGSGNEVNRSNAVTVSIPATVQPPGGSQTDTGNGGKPEKPPKEDKKNRGHSGENGGGDSGGNPTNPSENQNGTPQTSTVLQ
ncbi:transglycosylase domain-containing protein [Kyrpidia tusciae]|uniref:Penicillin-binding protein, 1A family n=1 Tax=Kyrpidia tusciae (strain DSM 2912 / NBRC 15312 / T2) TaxID=562970 RepID=D5WQ82_KYRT2|nr:PBP1A family penicillin-binding protein [Kyrpidia tusciae]ADG06491.1 penicillin-binding protein, 1A family [Kyrpidia tusciae DSM 2912]